MSFPTHFNVAIVGGGFFGCRAALLLARCGYQVALVEQENSLLQRASQYNQSRVHNGYHYPRSFMTAAGSHRHYKRFQEEYTSCLIPGIQHIYAVARQQSKVNAYQFRRFCGQVGLPLSSPSLAHQKLFDPQYVEETFLVEEMALDTVKLAALLNQQVHAEPGIRVFVGTTCVKLGPREKIVQLITTAGTIKADGVIIAAYAGLNPLLKASGLTPPALKAELTEMAFVRPPVPLQNMAITLMDGPFFSLFPFGGEKGVSTLSHVRYTPHVAASAEGEGWYDLRREYEKNQLTRFPFMRNDAARFVPAIRALEYVESLYEMKVVPVRNEVDDGRPILFREHTGILGGKAPYIVSLLGSKLDSIYEWEALLAERYPAGAEKREQAGLETAA
jgi:glycine/D-amino acid oxidase-like deaminating enzyme